MWEKNAKTGLDDAYHALVQEREKLKTIVEITGDMIFEYDIASDRMEYLSPKAGNLYPNQVMEHYAEKAVFDGTFESPDDAKRLVELIRSGDEHFDIELRRMGRDGDYHWVHVDGRTIFGRNSRPERVFGKVRNIDEQKIREQELLEKSRRDSLTGFLNNISAREEITEKLKYLPAGRPAFLVVCDIDDLKTINEINGHLFGDAVICSFANEIREKLPDSVLGRIGGDEFILYVENLPRARVGKCLTALNRFLKERFNDEKMGLEISCSFGAVAIGEDIRDFDLLFRWADSVLYKIKKECKGHFLILDVEAGMGVPDGSHTRKVLGAEAYTRNNALLQNDQDLALFCTELVENVPNATAALKIICENVCRFYGLEGAVYLEKPWEHTMFHDVESDELEILYAWNKQDTAEYIRRMHKRNIVDWNCFYDQTDSRGVAIYRENKYGEKSENLLLIFSKKVKDYQGCIVFSDRGTDRNWEAEKDILSHIAYSVFNRMHQIQIKQREHMEMERRFNYDALTGLPVYNKFISLAAEYLQENGREDLYCVYSDFSNFQYLNETLGYETGDIVLKNFGEALARECPGGIVFCRISSDQFAGFVAAENLRQLQKDYLDFTTSFVVKCHEMNMQCNLVVATGIYQVTEEDQNVSAMLDKANEARKDCKKQKFVTAVSVYDEKISKQSRREKEIITNVYDACEREELIAYLQPKISLKTGKVVGAEALARWIKKDGSMILPDNFISVCEKNGAITKIDFYILEKVMQYLHKAMLSGEEIVPVSVNFSRKHAESETFTADVFRVLEQYDVPCRFLEMEVTESVFTRDLHQVNEKVMSLKEAGVEVSVDDFGSGYSSFNTLTEIMADTIKLDKDLLKGAEEGNNKYMLVKSLVEMLKMLGFKVLVEGVETMEQLELLRRTDCDMVQGYYYGSPMPIKEFRRFLANFNHQKLTGMEK